jgi:hypothetical protein
MLAWANAQTGRQDREKCANGGATHGTSVNGRRSYLTGSMRPQGKTDKQGVCGYGQGPSSEPKRHYMRSIAFVMNADGSNVRAGSPPRLEARRDPNTLRVLRHDRRRGDGVERTSDPPAHDGAGSSADRHGDGRPLHHAPATEFTPLVLAIFRRRERDDSECRAGANQRTNLGCTASPTGGLRWRDCPRRAREPLTVEYHRALN